MDDEVFQAIKAFINERVKHAKLTTDDAWFGDKETLNLYLQLKILDRLESIDGTLITMLNPSGR